LSLVNETWGRAASVSRPRRPRQRGAPGARRGALL